MTFSRRAALVIGILLPLGETLRRWGTWFVDPPAYLDDLSIGAFLLIAFWLSARDGSVGRRYLAAAWGYACGMGYSSFFRHLANLDAPDPAPISNRAVTTIIGIGWAVCIVALFAALGSPNPATRSKA